MTISAMSAVALVALIMTAGAVNAEARTQQFYNDKGQIVSTASRNGDRTTYRDDKGRITGSSVTRGNTTTFYDSFGRQRGTAPSQGPR